jgi:NAD(P)-dependent dehydrogenase (short-subunit alcohol dehydrogenase family)
LPALVAATVERFGRLDALVNNASSFFPTPLGSIDLAAWDELVGSNLQAPLFLTQAAAPHLLAAARQPWSTSPTSMPNARSPAIRCIVPPRPACSG